MDLLELEGLGNSWRRGTDSVAFELQKILRTASCFQGVIELQALLPNEIHFQPRMKLQFFDQ